MRAHTAPGRLDLRGRRERRGELGAYGTVQLPNRGSSHGSISDLRFRLLIRLLLATLLNSNFGLLDGLEISLILLLIV